jgi:hypothetical protein
MLGFKVFETAQCTLAGVELMHILRKGQLEEGAGSAALRPNNSTPWPLSHPFQQGERSLRDLIVLLDDLTARDVAFRSLTESIDTTTPTGRAM